MNSDNDEVMLIPTDDISGPVKSRIVSIEPTDFSVRPPRPALLKAGLQAREEIAQWETWKKEQEKNDKTPQASET